MELNKTIWIIAGLLLIIVISWLWGFVYGYDAGMQHYANVHEWILYATEQNGSVR